MAPDEQPLAPDIVKKRAAAGNCTLPQRFGGT